MAMIKGRKHYSLSKRKKVLKYFYKNGNKTRTCNKYRISMTALTKWIELDLKGELGTSKSGKTKFKNMKHNWKEPNFKLFNQEDYFKYEGAITNNAFEFNNETKKWVRVWSRIQCYEYINKVMNNDNNKRKVTYLTKLLQVTRDSYYKWVNAGCPVINAYKDDNNKLVCNAFHKFKGILGYRRLKHYIKNKEGINMSYAQVRKYMKLNNLVAIKNGINKQNYNHKQNLNNTKNLINRNFTSDKPNTVWFMDYTFIKSCGKQKYVLFIKDGYDKRIVNYGLVDNKYIKQTKSIIKKALNNNEYDNLTIHNDQGTEFQNTHINDYLLNKFVIQSFSDVGEPLDNASVESLMGRFKREFNPEKQSLKSKAVTKRLIDDFVANYNDEIPMEVLNWQTPTQYNSCYNCI